MGVPAARLGERAVRPGPQTISGLHRLARGPGSRGGPTALGRAAGGVRAGHPPGAASTRDRSSRSADPHRAAVRGRGRRPRRRGPGPRADGGHPGARGVGGAAVAVQRGGRRAVRQHHLGPAAGAARGRRHGRHVHQHRAPAGTRRARPAAAGLARRADGAADRGAGLRAQSPVGRPGPQRSASGAAPVPHPADLRELPAGRGPGPGAGSDHRVRGGGGRAGGLSAVRPGGPPGSAGAGDRARQAPDRPGTCRSAATALAHPGRGAVRWAGSSDR